MDGLIRHYAKWNKSKTNTAWDNLYVESKKYNRLVSITKKKIHRYREQISGERKGGGGSILVGD